MNTEQAKNLNMVDVMSRLGYEPVTVRKGGTEYWYRSPFRQEAEPSFVVGPGKVIKWVWNDFGDRGGNVIDFVMSLNHYSSVSQALAFLDDLYRGDLSKTDSSNRVGANQLTFSFSQQAGRAAAKKNLPMQKHRQELELIKAHEIRSPAIYAYLVKERGLLRPLVNCYFKEVRYRHRKSGKQYFAIGMENQSGGYEIRAASDQYNFKKSCLGAKDITIIPGSSPGQSVNIFEGGIDCLSLMVMLNSDHLIGDSIILNSTSLFERAAEYIRQQSYKDIHTFLDNDQGGQECTEQFLQEFGERVNPQNDMYANYKDLNQALVDNLSSGFSTESV